MIDQQMAVANYNRSDQQHRPMILILNLNVNIETDKSINNKNHIQRQPVQRKYGHYR